MAWERFSLEDRVAIVTGGGTGIGRATALVLAEHGADVVLAGRRVELLELAAGEIEAIGRRALAVRTDVTDAAQCDELVRATLDGLGRLDILVNNAGGAMPKPTDGVERRGVARGPRGQPDECVVPVARRGEADAPAGEGLDRQHLVGCEPAGVAERGAVRRGQGGGEQPDRRVVGGVDAGHPHQRIAVGAVATEVSIETARMHGLDEATFGA